MGFFDDLIGALEGISDSTDDLQPEIDKELRKVKAASRIVRGVAVQ